MEAVRILTVLAAAAFLCHPAGAQTRWTGSWATSQQVPEPRNALAPGALDGATLRQSVHLSIGGAQLRVRLSNAFGTTPLHITAHVARAAASGSDAIVAGSDRVLRFAGHDDVTIPAGAEYVSDPAALATAPGADIAITLHFDAAPTQQTSHPGSRTTSYLVKGDHLADAALPGAQVFDHWFAIAGVDIAGDNGAVVALGDSITDGRGSTTNGNDRWTDDLARRLSGAGIGVLNHGIGGGHVLLDGLGPNAMARFDRDVLAQPGARWLIVFEGINDIGTFDPAGTAPPQAHGALVRQLTDAYGQMIAAGHAAGMRVYGATVTPFADSGPYHPNAASEADRIAVNAWIRGHFDAVVDFDTALRDPARPDHLRPAYDSGDGLHPSPAGYRALADAIPLSLFTVRKK
jgi:lysophospholipase L1-like esterase